MQWLIDIILELIPTAFPGMIVMWSGAVVDIPDGWALCDGNNGTPDLGNQFVLCTGDSYAVGDSGGSTSHNHIFEIGHSHSITPGTHIQTGTGFSDGTSFADKGRTTSPADTFPSYYTLAYIMKL